MFILAFYGYYILKEHNRNNKQVQVFCFGFGIALILLGNLLMIIFYGWSIAIENLLFKSDWAVGYSVGIGYSFVIVSFLLFFDRIISKKNK